VRFAWLQHVQHPLDAVYSDMGGYVDRAEGLIHGKTPAEPRILAMFPPGTHAILALEFLAFGRNGRLGIAVVHALVGAIPAACAPVLTARFVPKLAVAALVGVLVAFWYPQVAFTGFFSSELWFSAAIALEAWLSGRVWRRSWGQLSAGAAAAVAMVVRSQFMLTWGMEMLAVGLGRLRRRGLRATARDVTFLALPVALALTVTSVRFHRLTGRWGLMNDSGLNRIWADTDICKVEASWRTPNGEEWTYWFSPPSKPALKPSDSVTFRGYIVDPDILERIRRELVRGVPLRDRLLRKVHNVSLLLFGNLPWPESNYREPIRFVGFPSPVPRQGVAEAFRDALAFVFLPLCAAGLTLGRRNRTMLILAANLVTVPIAAWFFFGEARYHVPYDPFIVILAVVGAYELGRRALHLLPVVVRRPRAAAAPSAVVAEQA
jgi:hypothetical protein